MTGVPRRSSDLQDADALARRIRYEMGREIREARLIGGTSLRVAAARATMSHAQLGRIERGEVAGLSVEQLSRGCAAVGLRLLVRAVPGSGRPLDRGQLALIGRLRAELPVGVRVRTEVPLPIGGDRRAWDLVMDLNPTSLPVEAEARLRDLQSLQRRYAIKLRDGGFDRLVLIVGDTTHNRRLLAEYRAELREAFPLDTRDVMASLRLGRTPAASGIVVI
jgi:transcriptional regulator with XRE-family HTH domain